MVGSIVFLTSEVVDQSTVLLNLDSKVHANPIAALNEAEQKMDVR